MKTIKSALLGNRRISDTSPDILLAQLKGIIKEHRALVIARLQRDIPTYVQYKFETKTSRVLHDKIKDELNRLKDADADLKKYDTVAELLLQQEVIHLTNEPFYKEIDECLAMYVAEREFNFA